MTAANIPLHHPAIEHHGCGKENRLQQREPRTRDAQWRRSARQALLLAWTSLFWMLAEAVVGLWQGLTVGSIAMTGWALGGAVEGLASMIVIWRFTGSRTLSENAERRAQQGVAVSFWLLAPYITVESIHYLLGEHCTKPTTISILVTTAALLAMPVLGRAKRVLGARLGSAATAGDGAQNYLCAAQAAAVLVNLAVTARWPGAWWLDPIIGLGIAAAAIRAGIQCWRGHNCCS
ncbi:MAG: cation transporter [Mycobacteriaceae bacterium]|nr:cation transporter [Mycobacteriaceae bacterium]